MLMMTGRKVTLDDGGGVDPVVIPEEAVGEGPLCGGHDDQLAGDGVPDDLCACSDVPLYGGGVQGVRGVVEHGHDLYEEPPDAGGGVTVHTQIAVDEQIGPGLHEFVLSHEESAEIKPSEMIEIGFDFLSLARFINHFVGFFRFMSLNIVVFSASFLKWFWYLD